MWVGGFFSKSNCRNSIELAIVLETCDALLMHQVSWANFISITVKSNLWVEDPGIALLARIN
jgi:hypothetical protein